MEREQKDCPGCKVHVCDKCGLNWKDCSQDRCIEVLEESLNKIMSELKGYSDNTFGRNAYRIAERVLKGENRENQD